MEYEVNIAHLYRPDSEYDKYGHWGLVKLGRLSETEAKARLASLEAAFEILETGQRDYPDYVLNLYRVHPETKSIVD
jgi:hypothetical protein